MIYCIVKGIGDAVLGRKTQRRVNRTAGAERLGLQDYAVLTNDFGLHTDQLFMGTRGR